MREKATIVRRVKWGKELPNQLIVRGGILVMKDSGKQPLFDIPDETEVSVVPRDDLVKCVDDARLLRAIGG